MTYDPRLPAAASLPDLLIALTEANNDDVDLELLDVLVVTDPNAVLDWVRHAALLLMIDYQLRLLDGPIAHLCDEISVAGHDMDQVGSYTRQLSALIQHWQQLTTARKDTHGAFRRACDTARAVAAPILSAAVPWVDTRLVCRTGQEAQSVRIPGAEPGPWRRVKVRATTLADIAVRDHTVRPSGPLVRRRRHTFDLITPHDGGHAVLPLLADQQGWYLLTGITWFRPTIGNWHPAGVVPQPDSAPTADPDATTVPPDTPPASRQLGADITATGGPHV